MDITKFQKHAVGTLKIKDKDISALSHRGFGLMGEAGHTAQIIKRIIRDQEGVASEKDISEIKKRLGDVMYYTAVLADYYNLDLTSIAEDNMAQSTDFENGKYQS